MQFTAYQIVTPLISFIAVTYAWNLVLRQRKTIWEAILWSMFWGTIAYIALFPDALDYLTAATGIKDRENAVVVTFLGIISFILFYLIIRIEEMEQRQTRVIRKLALKDLDKK
ncbi:MAG: DUF2304 domain-containing protein [Candidatus Peregrinibacteria bacterium]|nr:DUF2304 domain-containing protein [Candidatus Peregrinibacteria bacterium]MCB9808041.1 DUF2304 domain-containing protein [Candidatus Peribacteria bacterium]